MKRLFAVTGLLLIAFAVVSHAAGPEDEYLSIYYRIQQGDNAAAAGNEAEAAACYQAAQDELQRLKNAYPTWQNNVVGYRLKYLARKLSELKVPPMPQTTPRDTTVKPTSAAPPKTPAEDEAMQREIAALQAQVQQLLTRNDSLQAKLREALSVRPTAGDPAELARAEETIRQMSRENELLKVSLDDAKARASATASARELAQLREELAAANKQLAIEADRARKLARDKGDLENRLSKITTSPRDTSSQRAAERSLEEMEQRLTAQQALASQLQRERQGMLARLRDLETQAANAAALRAENDLLRRQVQELKAATPAAGETGQLSVRLAAAEAQIAALQSERDILKLERAALESRVVQLTAAARAAPARSDDARRIRQLEDQIEELERKLAEANRQLARRIDANAGERADELAAQLAAARSKLEVYEAKPVPYSAEELALFRQAPPRLASTDRPAHKSSSIPKPPAGSGQLVAEAQRHFAQGEFAKAEEKYREVLRLDDKNVYTLANLAAIQIEEGKLDAAEKNLRQALAIAPDDGYSVQMLGCLKFRQANYDDALVLLSQAAQLDPANAEIQNYLGVTLSHKGQRGAAESALRKALTLEPGYANAHLNLAVIYATQTPPSVALARWHYQKAVAAGHPKNPKLEKLFNEKDSSTTP